MIFSGLVADEVDVLPRAVERIMGRAQELGLLVSPPWSSCQLKLDEDDLAWLLDWAEFWTADEANRWTKTNSAAFDVPIAGRQWKSYAVVGALMLVFCAECARREGKESKVWPAVLWDENDEARFALAHDEFWSDNDAPRGKVRRILKLGARALGVRHCFRGGNEQEYIGTIRLQFGFTYNGCSRLPDWLCGYSWPAPIRDLVRDRQLASPSFQSLWSSLHDLRDGNLGIESWKDRHQNSAWILPEWADEIAHNARAKLELAPVLDTRVGADESRAEGSDDDLSESVAAIWEAQSPPATLDFLDANSVRLLYDDHRPTFYCDARPFPLPPDATWFGEGVTILTLYAGQTRLGIWLYNDKQRAFISQHKQWKLPLTEPTLTVRLVANSQTVVARQTLSLWDASDGLGLWNAESGRRLNVWRHVPRASNSYILLVDGDLSIEPMPAHWQEIGERRLLWPDANWWRSAEIRDGDQSFWKPLLREEPDWARGFEVSLNKDEPLRLGQSFNLRVQIPIGATIESLRWGGRILRPLADDLYQVAPLSSDNLVASLPLQIAVCGPDGQTETLERRVSLPLCAVLFRGDSQEQWQIADGQEIWDVAQARQWRLLGSWSESARLCEGGVPFDTVPRRSNHVRAPQTWGAPLSVREPPYGSADVVLKLCASARNGGLVSAFKTVATSQIDVTLNHLVAPDADHSLIIWGQDGAVCQVRGDEVLGKSNRWMVPFSLGGKSRVLAVGLAYEGVWLGAHFEQDWWSLCPRNWNALDSAEAARFALLLRWMRLPWREAPRPVLAFARHWPVEALRMWLGVEENEFGLQFSASDESGQSWVREAFREGFEGTPAQAKAAIAPFGNVMNLLKLLGQADPFLALKFARVLSANYQAAGFASLLRRALQQLECDAEPDVDRNAQSWQNALKTRYALGNLEEFERRALRLALESERNRCRAAALLFEWLAHDLTHPQP